MEPPITLISNTDDYSYNSIAEFRTKLAQPLIVDDNSFIGLSEISYTKSWWNVKQNHILSVLSGSDELVLETKIKSGFYDSAEVLINKINQALKGSEKIKENPNLNYKSPIIEYNKLKNTAKILAGSVQDNPVFPVLGKEIEGILGFKTDFEKFTYDFSDEATTKFADIILIDRKMFEDTKIKAIRPVDITNGYHAMYLYCDVICPTVIGNSFTQILKVVQVDQDKSFGKQCYFSFEKPTYHKFLYRNIDNIKITMYDDAGELIPFKFGRVIITLKRKNYKKETEAYFNKEFRR